MSTRLLTAAATASHIKEPTDCYSKATASKTFQRGTHTYGPTATRKYAKQAQHPHTSVKLPTLCLEETPPEAPRHPQPETAAAAAAAEAAV